MLNIASRIDQLPMTPMLKKVLLLTGIGWMFDAMDQGMVSGVMAAIGKEWAPGSQPAGFAGRHRDAGDGFGRRFVWYGRG